MLAQPAPVQLPPNTFLLNPKREGFLNGFERKLYDFTASTIFVFVFIAVTFGGVGAALFYAGWQENNTRTQLQQNGVEAQATVTNLEHTTSKDSKGRTTNHYYVTYEFYAGEGNSDTPTSYRYKESISYDTYSDLFEGEHITIRYMPSDPSVSRYLDDTSDNGVIYMIFGFIFISIVVVTLYFPIRQQLRNRVLIADGQLIQGKIVEATGGRVKGGYQVSVQYRFLTPDGVELKRQESLIRNDLRGTVLPHEGTPVAVLYVDERLYRML